MTELPADMEGRLDHYLSERAKMSQIDRNLIHGLNVGDTREAVLTVADLRDLLKAYQVQRRALEAASPVVPVGVRERVLDELDKAWLHGQRRTSWRRDESADAILAALRPTERAESKA